MNGPGCRRKPSGIEDKTGKLPSGCESACAFQATCRRLRTALARMRIWNCSKGCAGFRHGTAWRSTAGWPSNPAGVERFSGRTHPADRTKPGAMALAAARDGGASHPCQCAAVRFVRYRGWPGGHEHAGGGGPHYRRTRCQQPFGSYRFNPDWNIPPASPCRTFCRRSARTPHT